MKKTLSILPPCILFVCFFISMVGFGQPYPKIRIGFEDDQGFRRPLLLTFIPGTTAGVDFGFDGALSSTESTDSYWLIANDEYAIQAIEEPTNNTELPFGVDIGSARDIFFVLDSVEDMSQPFEILLKDTQQAQLFDLNLGNFQVTMNAGTYLNRFSLVVFPSAILGVEEQGLDSRKIEVAWSKEHGKLFIKKLPLGLINMVTMYDMNGREVMSTNRLDGDISAIDLKVAQGVYILMLNTNQSTTYKRIIID